MVLVEDGRFVPASLLKKGDQLVRGNSGELVTVQSVRTVVCKGVYAPFTAFGTIVVDNILASNYITYQGPEYLEVANFATPLTY